MVADETEVEDVDVILLRFRGKEDELDIVVIKPKDVELYEDTVSEIIVKALKDYGLCYYWNGSIVREVECNLIGKDVFIAKDVGDYVVVFDNDLVKVLNGEEVADAVSKVRDAGVKVVEVRPSPSSS